MSVKDDSKITWVTCPDCGSKIGIVISVGKAKAVAKMEEVLIDTIPAKLEAAGVNLELVDVEEGEEIIIISPKRFLGDLWGPVNDAIRSLGGTWIREGRESHWELSQEKL